MSKFILEENNSLYAKFVFMDFIEAINFTNKVAEIAERQNHHPKIIINYNIVELFLSTHDEGNTVTDKDYKLAEAILRIN